MAHYKFLWWWWWRKHAVRFFYRMWEHEFDNLCEIYQNLRKIDSYDILTLVDSLWSCYATCSEVMVNTWHFSGWLGETECLNTYTNLLMCFLDEPIIAFRRNVFCPLDLEKQVCIVTECSLLVLGSVMLLLLLLLQIDVYTSIIIICHAIICK